MKWSPSLVPEAWAKCGRLAIRVWTGPLRSRCCAPDLTSDPAARQRFEREARAVAALSHPHICPLFDIGHQDGTDYLVMEFLEGETLAQRLTRGKLPLDQGLQYGIQIADALAAAHKAGIIHRDLKPGNIMLTKSGAKLLDFGLAKPAAPIGGSEFTQVATHAPPTGAGTLVGTLQYMAPEQLQGSPADARTDVFAFGCVLYEMVSGRPAFAGATPASVIAAILEREPAPMAVGSEPIALPVLKPLFGRASQRTRPTVGPAATMCSWHSDDWGTSVNPPSLPGHRGGRRVGLPSRGELQRCCS